MQTVQSTYGSELQASSRSTYHRVLHTGRTSPTIDDHRAPATTDPTPYVAGIMETHRPSTDEIHGLSMPMSIISFMWNVDVEFAVHISRNQAVSASMCTIRLLTAVVIQHFPNPFAVAHYGFGPFNSFVLFLGSKNTFLFSFFLFTCASIAIRGLGNRL